MEESRELGAGWELEELKDKLSNGGKKEIVSLRRRAGQVLQREQRTDRNLRGAEPYESVLRERKVESKCYGKAKRKCRLVRSTFELSFSLAGENEQRSGERK
mgnify:CR=1 FL=1